MKNALPIRFTIYDLRFTNCEEYGVKKQQITNYTTMENDNTMTAAQNEPGMLKMSVILEAIDNESLEFDVPGVLLFFGEKDGAGASDFTSVTSLHKQVVLRILSEGLPFVVSNAMQGGNARAMGLLGEAYGMRCEFERTKLNDAKIVDSLREIFMERDGSEEGDIQG